MGLITKPGFNICRNICNENACLAGYPRVILLLNRVSSHELLSRDAVLILNHDDPSSEFLSSPGSLERTNRYQGSKLSV